MSQIDPTTGANVTSTRVGDINVDKPLIATDTNPGSPFFNNIYVVWEHFSATPFINGTPKVLFSRSADQAMTWSTPLQLSNMSVEGFVWPADASVAPNGDVYVAYHSHSSIARFDQNPDGRSGQTFVLRSTDGGVTFAQKNLAFGPGQSDVTLRHPRDSPASVVQFLCRQRRPERHGHPRR